MRKVLSFAWKVAVTVLILAVLAFAFTPVGRAFYNTRFFNVQKVDDATRYKTRKEVEDSCRAMIASYTSDKMTYDQYKNSDDEEKRSWAEQARMRANKTAASYNEYVLKNSFVFDGNIPDDILETLDYITN